MSAERPEVKEFFSTLHRGFFKPRGFTKSGRTFTRDEGAYALAFQFQGSRWNDSGTPWVFYLNAGIRFPDIPRREPDRDFPTIHAWARVGRALSSRSESEYQVAAPATDQLVHQIQQVVEDTAGYFTARHKWLRKEYTKRPVPYLGYLDPQLMRE